MAGTGSEKLSTWQYRQLIVAALAILAVLLTILMLLEGMGNTLNH